MQQPSLFLTSGNYAPNGDAYIERSSDRQAQRRYSAGDCLYTFAPRQMGKTSLFQHMAGLLARDGWKTCHISLGALGRMEGPKWFQSLATKIGYCCDMDVKNIHVTDQFEFDIFVRYQVGLQDNPSRWLALFLDEVEGLLKNPDFSDEFLETVRGLVQSRIEFQGKFFLGIAGWTDKDQLVRNKDISPMNVMNEVKLADFTLTETKQVVNRLKLAGLAVQPGLAEQVYEWTGGQPHLTSRLCACLHEKALECQVVDITSALLDEVIEQDFNPRDRADSNLSHIYSHMKSMGGLTAKTVQNLLDGKIGADHHRCSDFNQLGVTRMAGSGMLEVKNRLYRDVLAELMKKLP